MVPLLHNGTALEPCPKPDTRTAWGAGQELTLAWLHKFYPTLRNRDLMERMQNMPTNFFYSMALVRIHASCATVQPRCLHGFHTATHAFDTGAGT